MQHPTFSATLAEQHRDELRRQAQQACRAQRARSGSHRRWRAALRWRPATPTASA
jgi:hypothetical protein